ncbi:hypothetical protein OJ996_20535 [Luteolibacter sp. GHJ8]|uniref:BstA-like C-terminal domain-containing protein n=1 Tax=Luteolibacter rhizosphaerae TaxID=2989719 RepID=A0ABT3G810_9BACT|nr:hypothetical protein [Luteolibacter rhizosphaerae]MCW1915987.1 hypothetical protein [Luteolibacter rhizosphaerae]
MVLITVVLAAANDWAAEQFRPRGRRIADLLNVQGYDLAALFHPVVIDGSTHHAFPEQVCMAFLEYYSFDAGPNIKEQALRNFRWLARSSLRVFVYTQVGYDAKSLVPAAWQSFQDRVSLSYCKVPVGYFSIFKEIADMVVTMIQSGVPVGDKTVPDISVGIHWGNHWRSNNFDEVYGQRVKFEQDYPEHFPQAASNPHEPWAYPECALPEFRRWMRETYFAQKFAAYLNSQVKGKALPAAVAALAIEAVAPKVIEA